MSVAIVCGALANKPGNAGEAWVRMSWVRGLARLGFDTWLVEEIDPGAGVAPDGSATRLEESWNLSWFRQTARQFGILPRAVLIGADGRTVYGLSRGQLRELAGDAALLVNISGNLRLRDVLDAAPRKAYLDLDPGFTQFWLANGDSNAGLAGHDHYFTVAENIGTATCEIPTGDLRWHPVRPPVVLEDWPVTDAAARDRFTTVASWRGAYGPVTYGGRTFGLKVHEFRKFIGLPGVADAAFEIALAIHPADRGDHEALLAHGWVVEDPRAAVPDADGFRSYVQGSAAEFSVAQGIYVETRSGWFSDRSTRYLASGRPVLVQDTGFGRGLPTEEGLVAFRTPEDAAAGAGRILSDYETHARAARAIAETYFDSDRVLAGFLDTVGAVP